MVLATYPSAAAEMVNWSPMLIPEPTALTVTDVIFVGLNVTSNDGPTTLDVTPVTVRVGAESLVQASTAFLVASVKTDCNAPVWPMDAEDRLSSPAPVKLWHTFSYSVVPLHCLTPSAPLNVTCSIGMSAPALN